VRSTNRVIRPFVIVLTVGLLVAILVPLATRSTRAGQGNTAQAQPVVVGFNGLQEGQTLNGKVAIEAVVNGDKIDRVDFTLDGPKSGQFSDRRVPYFLRGDDHGVPRGWDTTRYPDGDYSLTATVIDRAGGRGTSSTHFRIANHVQPPIATTAEPAATRLLDQPETPLPSATAYPAPSSGPVVSGLKGVEEGQALSGTVAIEAVVAGNNITQVVFQLDGPKSTTHTEHHAPYFFLGDNSGVPRGWDTTQYSNGDYTMTVTAADAANQTGAFVVHFPIINVSQPQPPQQPTATATAAPSATATPQQPTATATAAPPATATPPIATATAAPTTTPPSSTGQRYFVATDGNDANPGTEAQPFRTLNRGASALVPGDTLLVKPGTYVESLLDTIPSGKDWNSPVVIQASDPANRPILKPNPGAGWVLHFQAYRGQNQRYIVVDGFVLDAANVTHDVVKITGGANHIRLMNSEVKNAPNQGILTSEPGSDYNEFINLDIHDNGDDAQFEHGLYISTANNIVDRCTIHHNAGYGLHFYSGDPAYQPNNNVARNNRLYDGQGRYGGIILSVGDSNVVYNNIIYDTPSGIQVGYKASNAKVYNNVVYGLTGGTAGAGNGVGIYVFANNTSNSIYNNIVSRNSGVGIRNESTGNTLIKNNLTYANSQDMVNNGTAGLSDNIAGRDPLFVDPASRNFHLQAASPAIDAGLVMAEVNADADGIARPFGAAPDIGAYEYRAP
jgi:parallel beta helix pectate lyase-like protein/pectate lyase-like protein